MGIAHQVIFIEDCYSPRKSLTGGKIPLQIVTKAAAGGKLAIIPCSIVVASSASSFLSVGFVAAVAKIFTSFHGLYFCLGI